MNFGMKLWLILFGFFAIMVVLLILTFHEKYVVDVEKWVKYYQKEIREIEDSLLNGDKEIQMLEKKIRSYKKKLKKEKG